MEYRLARRMSELTASEVREILKVTERPEIISFAGGLPAPELFPAADLAIHARNLLEEEGTKALQYAPTEGHLPLREWIASRMTREWEAPVDPEEVLITSGSQQGLDLVGKLFLDEGDLVFCETPTYLAALGSFQVFGARFRGIPTDDGGMDLQALEEALRQERPKFIYVVPNAQNPSGRTWTKERRQGFMDIVTRYEIPVVEDNAYYEILFDGPPPPAMRAWDPKKLLVCLGSFSKVLCPGLRVGWIATSTTLLSRLVVLKQSADLHTANFSQMLIMRYLDACDLDARLEHIRDVYRQRRDAMLAALEEELPPGVRFTRPAGGMFVWLEMPKGLDARQILERCLEVQVAFVPGAAFYPGRTNPNTARLNFSNMPPDKIRLGVRRFAQVLIQAMKTLQEDPPTPPTRTPAVGTAR